MIRRAGRPRVRHFVTSTIPKRSAACLFSLILISVGFVGPARPASATTLVAGIDPLLQQRMLQNPLTPQPVIVEMEHVTSPLLGVNLQLANRALDLLRLNGTARVALP